MGKSDQEEFEGCFWFIIIIGVIAYFTGYLGTFIIISLSIAAIVFLFSSVEESAKRKKILKSGITEIDSMSGEEFEAVLFEHYKEQGYEVIKTPKSGDYGADLIISKDGLKGVVQAKRAKGKIGIKAVQEVVAAIKFYQADYGVVITNNYFTNSAKELALSNHILLLNRKKLTDFLYETKQKYETKKETNGDSEVIEAKKLSPYLGIFGLVVVIIIFLIIYPFGGEDRKTYDEEPIVAEEKAIQGEKIKKETKEDLYEEIDYFSKQEYHCYLKEREMLVGSPQVVLNFREGPALDYEVKSQIEPETKFFVLGGWADWYYVFIPKYREKGWLFKEYLVVLLYLKEASKVEIFYIGTSIQERGLNTLFFGMDQLEVMETVGAPEYMGENVWYFANSPVYFSSHEKVIGWEDRDEILKVDMPKGGFSIEKIEEIYNDKFKALIFEKIE